MSSDILASITKTLDFQLCNVIYLALGQNEADRDFTIEAEKPRFEPWLVVFMNGKNFAKCALAHQILLPAHGRKMAQGSDTSKGLRKKSHKPIDHASHQRW